MARGTLGTGMMAPLAMANNFNGPYYAGPSGAAMGALMASQAIADGLRDWGESKGRQQEEARVQAERDRLRAEEMNQRRAVAQTLSPTGYVEQYGDMGNRPTNVAPLPDAGTQMSLYNVAEAKRKEQESAEYQKKAAFAQAWAARRGYAQDPTGEKFAAQVGYNPFEYEGVSSIIARAEEKEAQRQWQEEMKREGYRQAQILAGMRGGGGEKEYKPDLFVNAQGQTAWVKPGDPIPQGFFPHSNSMGIEVNQDGTTTINTNGKLKPVPNAAASSLTANFGVMSRIQSALNANAEAPDAGGMFYGMINDVAPTMMNKIDPGGTEARATTGDVSSMVIHDRSGAAVTVSEYPRFRPFIPTVYDSYEEKQKKLELLYKAIELETSLYADNFSEGYRMPESWGKYLGSSPVIPEKKGKSATQKGGGGWGNDTPVPDGYEELP